MSVKLVTDQRRIMVDETDWRLNGQEKFLSGVYLRRRRYTRRECGDHAHCEFCWAKFMEESHPGDPEILHEGYATEDKNIRWICSECFRDFRERFAWTLTRQTT
jgi:hypothetical protein